ncbi:granzyme A-like [Hyperolius riggenbachi]|uniref:granzyme A-like n=1 Tax=Hyperolius riggenbachi TaxID=752182 RepID=UPI0035A3BB3D
MRVFLPLFAATFTLLIHPCECMEIIGGREAKPHSRPYMALITKSDVCGGTLIDWSWVLTAAHCKIDNSTRIKLGLHSLSREDQYVQNFTVLKWLKYPYYDQETLDNDLQLVKLSGKAKCTKAVQPLKLPTIFCDVKPKTLCEAAGWGKTNNKDIHGSDKLMEVILPAISRRKCAAMLYPDGYVITKNMMCTLDPTGGKDTCNGDSGGPLICKKKYRGIISFGPLKCGDPQRPAVYTFLTKDHVYWIKKVIKKETE